MMWHKCGTVMVLCHLWREKRQQLRTCTRGMGVIAGTFDIGSKV